MEIGTLAVTLNTYETALEKPRTQISHVFASYFAEKNPKTLLLFWITFSSQGIGMTKPVEDWIKRAGNSCEALGYKKLGKQLGKHAIHEANHHLMMIEDTKRLVDKWNKLYSPKLDAEELIKQPGSEAVINYQELHEHYIEGKNPYCQIAIEYEIENLSAVYGLKMVNHAIAVLGEAFKESLSFMDEHAAIDVAHTQFNRTVISNFIDSYPETTNNLINGGTKALKAYGDFITTCLKRSKDLLALFMKSKDCNEVKWEVKSPIIANPGQSMDWLISLAEMRGYGLYENGQRPYFKIGDNQFLDNDPFDISSYHILVTLTEKIIGCIRLLPLKSDLNCVTSQIISKKTFGNIIYNFFGNIDGLAETSRWIVHPDYRHSFIGYNLMHAFWALAKYLGYKCIANSGQQSQKLINHYGAVYIMDHTKPFFSEKYNDYISVIYFDELKLTSRALTNIQKMKNILRLTEPLVTHV